MKNETPRQKIIIIAGPCSLNSDNIEQLYRIADIRVVNSLQKSQQAIWGLRVVGLKSRTSMNSTGEGMGMDFHEYMYNANLIASQKSIDEFKIYPSAIIAKQLTEKTGLVVAAEIMDPIIQLPILDSKTIVPSELKIY